MKINTNKGHFPILNLLLQLKYTFLLNTKNCVYLSVDYQNQLNNYYNVNWNYGNNKFYSSTLKTKQIMQNFQLQRLCSIV